MPPPMSSKRSNASFPAGKTEFTFRSKELKDGHVEQFRVNLQGEQLILIDRSYQRPRGYTAPDTPLPIRIYTRAGPFLLVAVFIIGWGFGLYYLFKTKNWDALTRRMPIAICILVIVQVGLQVIGSSGVFESLIGVVAVTIMLIGVALPALSGVLLWIGHRSPARMWAAGTTDARTLEGAGRVGIAALRCQRRRGAGGAGPAR